MIGFEDAPYTFEYKEYFKILPPINNWNLDKKRIKKGKIVDKNFSYRSDNNKDWMSILNLKTWIEKYKSENIID